MLGIQRIFDDQIKAQFKPNAIGVSILKNEFEKINIFLSEEQCADIKEQFQNLDKGIIDFDFSDEQIEKSGISSQNALQFKIEEILDELPSKISKFTDSFSETVDGLIETITDDASISIYSSLSDSMEQMQVEQDELYHGFAEEIQEIWESPLKLLQGLIVIVDEVSQGYFPESDDDNSDDIVLSLLLRIHVKAIQVSKEILTLLKNGFPDGAQARWRTLHELTVIGIFISEHGEDLAERYINHDSIEMYKAAIQYNKYYTQLDDEIPKGEIDSMRQTYEGFLEQYGANYKYDFGWAANALKMKKPTFKDIEASVNLDHQRPYYRRASSNVHANPSGLFSSLGLFPEEDILLAGPSDIGLDQPAQSTVISLNQITLALTMYKMNLDTIVIGKVLNVYGDKVSKAFLEVARSIE